MCETCSYTGAEVMNVKDAAGNIVATGNLKTFNRFSRIESKATPFIPAGDNTLTIEVQNYSGDLMIDHVGESFSLIRRYPITSDNVRQRRPPVTAAFTDASINRYSSRWSIGRIPILSKGNHLQLCK